MRLTKECIINRDEIVFRIAFKNKIPIIMLLSGGYQKINAKVIADSIINLAGKFQEFKNHINI